MCFIDNKKALKEMGLTKGTMDEQSRYNRTHQAYKTLTESHSWLKEMLWAWNSHCYGIEVWYIVGRWSALVLEKTKFAFKHMESDWLGHRISFVWKGRMTMSYV